MGTVKDVGVRLGAAGLLMLALAGCGGSGDEHAAAFTAQPASDAGTRRQALATTTTTATPRPVGTTALLDWAERNFPQHFPGHQDDQSVSPYTYRYYPETGNYVGVANGRAMILGPVSGGALADVGAISDFRCQVYAWECQPNPLLTAKWQTGVALETGDDDVALESVGIDDAGRATAMFTQYRRQELRLFASQTLLPDANGIMAWTAQQPLDEASEFHGPTPPQIGPKLLVAANGVVVAVWNTRATCLPGTYGYGPPFNRCYYVMANRFDPATGRWSGAIRIADSLYAGSFKDAQVDREGNFAVLVNLPKSVDQQRIWFWGSGTPSPISVALPTQALSSKQLVIAGKRLFVAGVMPRDSANEMVLYRGTVEGGFGAEELIGTRGGDASLLRLIVSPAGRAVVIWTQRNGTRNAMYLSDASSFTAPLKTAEQSHPLYSDLLLNYNALTFNDAGELWLPTTDALACNTHRLVDGVWVETASMFGNVTLCASFLPARNRNGDILVSEIDGWFLYDSRTESVVRPDQLKKIIPGLDGVLPGQGRAVLSANGTAVYVATANYDVLPTRTQPNGVGRAQVRNLWGWVLR